MSDNPSRTEVTDRREHGRVPALYLPRNIRHRPLFVAFCPMAVTYRTRSRRRPYPRRGRRLFSRVNHVLCFLVDLLADREGRRKVRVHVRKPERQEPMMRLSSRGHCLVPGVECAQAGRCGIAFLLVCDMRRMVPLCVQ